MALCVDSGGAAASKAAVAVRDHDGANVLANGKGMRVLGFVPLGGLKALGKKPEPEPAAGKALGKKPEPEPAAGKADQEAVEIPNGAPTQDFKRRHDGYQRSQGSYRNYYSYRHGAACDGGALDRRLEAIVKRWSSSFFTGKEVLDIGCNSGTVSLMVARQLAAKRVVGMDVDPALIQVAKAAAGQESLVDGGGADVEFREEDFLKTPSRKSPSMEPERFDVVLCMSVTKWVHFAHGDDGIRRLFKRIFKRLRPGGTFVLEPQEWRSYKKKMYLTAEIRQTVQGIELQPTNFRVCLEELGFEHCGTIAPPKDGPRGFQRSVYLYKKPEVGQGQMDEGEAGPQDRQTDEAPSKDVDEEVEAARSTRRAARRAARKAAEEEEEVADEEEEKKAAQEAPEGTKPKKSRKKRKAADEEEEAAGEEEEKEATQEAPEDAKPKKSQKKRKAKGGGSVDQEHAAGG